MSQVILAYLKLRKEGRIGRAWIEGGVVLLVPEGAATDLQAAAESMSKQKFASIVNGLLEVPILAPPTPQRKPVVSVTRLDLHNYSKIG